MRIRTIEELLVESRLFADLAPQHLETIAGCASIVHFDEGETIFREGGPADTFYVLRSGAIAIGSGSVSSAFTKIAFTARYS